MDGSSETDFDPAVPLARASLDSPGGEGAGGRLAGLEDAFFLGGDQRFESPSLRQGVCLTGAFHGYRRKGPAFAGSVSLDVTRERDVVATSRLALAAFL
jgi:hypothetical protein